MTPEKKLTPEEEAQARYDRVSALMVKLSQSEEFQIWRDEVCQPLLTQLEDKLRNSDTLDEATLRGSLKHYFSEKYRFYDVFEIARTNIELNEEAN